MYTRRLLSHHLTLVCLLFVSGSSACVSNRYVGVITDSGQYANRGFGVTVRIKGSPLEHRWTVVDPEHPQRAPEGIAADRRQVALDLDGDGMLHPDEIVEHNRPTLRLFRLLAGGQNARLDLDVEILSGSDRQQPLRAFVRHTLKTLGNPLASECAKIRKIGPDFKACVVETEGIPERRIAVIDQANFRSGDGTIRRQLVKVVLTAPEVTEELRVDHEALLMAIGLNQKADTPSRQEQW